MKSQSDRKAGPRFQFGFKTLFVLTAAVAVCCMICAWLEQAVILRTLFLVYVVPLSIYVVLRGPVIYRHLCEAHKRRFASRRRLMDSMETLHDEWAKKQAGASVEAGK